MDDTYVLFRCIICLVTGFILQTAICEDYDECYRNANGEDYRGTVSVTVSGNTCLNWMNDSLASYPFNPTYFPNSGLGDHNHCRNPNPSVYDAVFCFSSGVEHTIELCDIGNPNENCQTIVPTPDYCARQDACFNGAICIHPATDSFDYVCICQDGWRGRDCHVSIDDCELDSCHNGGICVDGHMSYTCTCQTGWTGEECETNIDECRTQDICQNGGTCEDSRGSYRCVCPSMYNGEHCEVGLDDHACSSNPCQNGECQVVRSENFYACLCNEGWQGVRCDEKVCNDCGNNRFPATTTHTDKSTFIHYNNLVTEKIKTVTDTATVRNEVTTQYFKTTPSWDMGQGKQRTDSANVAIVAGIIAIVVVSVAVTAAIMVLFAKRRLNSAKHGRRDSVVTEIENLSYDAATEMKQIEPDPKGRHQEAAYYSSVDEGEMYTEISNNHGNGIDANVGIYRTGESMHGTGHRTGVENPACESNTSLEFGSRLPLATVKVSDTHISNTVTAPDVTQSVDCDVINSKTEDNEIDGTEDIYAEIDSNHGSQDDENIVMDQSTRDGEDGNNTEGFTDNIVYERGDEICSNHGNQDDEIVRVGQSSSNELVPTRNRDDNNKTEGFVDNILYESNEDV
ncbi:uncharacterized protein LOC102804294 [Saccoglossus kowalevskii]|uniref:Slit homolog 1 protein-like n=1 Tax=Saccoglossus kowalevskii TaxID=10224 RepID=A0ABM0MJN5_SACKO|nr:PREDICTED: slit homolog 1 protein-like [Saccoglossus kowalevskii]